MHEMAHTGVKPFTWYVCGTSFTDSSNLKRHDITHTTVKPFKCYSCGISFVQSCQLKVHERTHTGVKPFTCDTAPNYLVQLINHRNVARTLRSSSSTELLFVPKSRTVTHGDRCFEVASPILWNNLPESLRTTKCLTQFRSQLKMHLFKVAFT